MPYGATPDAKITKTVSPRAVGRAKAPEVLVMNVRSGSCEHAYYQFTMGARDATTKVAVFSEVN